MTLPDEDAWFPGVRTLALRDEWPQIRRMLDRQRPAPLGLIRTHSRLIGDLGLNHQVLAYGYEASATGALEQLRLYDPNHPGTEVVLSVDQQDPLAPLVYSTGEMTRGFFLSPYRKRDPRFLTGGASGGPGRSLTGLIARLRGLMPG
jgi:hypothetical protein